MTTQTLANGLIYGNKWHKTTITYSFKNSQLPYELNADYSGNVPVSSALKTAANDIFDYIGSILNLNFVYEANTIGDIVISQKQMSDPHTLGYTYMPYTDTISQSGDVYISSAFSNIDFIKGGMGYATLIHEFGHALGLDHPFGNGTYSGVTIDQSVMSYNPYKGYDSFNNGYYYDTSSFTSYQAADILALQSLYGAKVDTSDTVYDLKQVLFGTTINGYTGIIKDNVATIYDYGGNDTLSLKNIVSTNAQYIDLRPGSQSVIVDNQIHHYLSITQDTYIENVIGSSANDIIVLNTLNNTVNARDGYDTVIEDSIYSPTRVDVFGKYIVVSGADSGFDVMQNVESLYIDNSSINLNNYHRNLIQYTDAKDAEVGRLYLSVFDRVADIDGLNYWVDNLNNNQTINDVANSFVQSAEFTSLYTSEQTDVEFIDTLYKNVLLRPADSAGQNYWIDEMNHGMTKADVFVGFSNSQEFINLTGIYFQDNMMVVS